MPSRVMTLRRDGVCCRCSTTLPKGAEAYWNADERTVTCLGCLQALTAAAARSESRARAVAEAATDRSQRAPKEPVPELDRGHAGASAAREHRRRQTNREARTRRSHPRVGGLLLALSGTPQHERAWDVGSRGEETVGRLLERRTEDGPAIVLHDRQMPNSRANIDHLAIAPLGVFVIDAKAISGKARIARPLLGTPKLMVRNRNRTKLVDSLDRQVAAVRRVLADSSHPEVPVSGVFCFTKAELPLLGAGEIRGYRLHHCRATARKLNRPGPLDADAIRAVAKALADSFPCA
jgi:Nuclease-related domain